MNCCRKRYLRAAKTQGAQSPNDIFVPSHFELTSNSANLQKIVCNSGITVPLQLLAIEESINCEVDVCNDSPNYDGFVCFFDHTRFAHIYITTENNNAFFKHYVIAFVEGVKIGKYNELIDVLCSTIELLKIENERPYFFIYYHGQQPVFETEIDNARMNIIRALKTRLKNYKTGESFCEASKIRRDATNFTIYESNPYRFNVS